MNRTQLKAVICAGQRSGTTALHHILRKNGVFCPGEVFHPGRLEKDAFLTFLAERGIAAGELFENPVAVWEHYVSYLSELAGETDIVLDIKYNSWHHFNGPWHQPVNPPTLLSMLPEDCWVIHIVREDIFAQVMSGIIAQKRGKFHCRSETDLRDLEFSVNVRNFKARVAQIQSVNQKYENWLDKWKKTIFIKYEEMYSENRLTPICLEALSQTGLELDFVETSLRKPKTDFSAMVTNYEELKGAYTEVA